MEWAERFLKLGTIENANLKKIKWKRTKSTVFNIDSAQTITSNNHLRIFEFFLNIEKNQDGLLINFLGTRPQTETESSTSRLLLSKYHPLHRYSQRRITWPVPPPGYYFSSTTHYTGTVSTGQHDQPHLLATNFQVPPTTQVQSAQDNMTSPTCRLLLP